MKILVTGAAGFIGSHVVDSYLLAGHEVAALDDLSSGSTANLPSEVRLFVGDIADPTFVAGVFADFQPEIINHHAAQASVTVSTKNPLLDARTNVLGMLTLLEAARVTPSFKKFIYATTGGAMYGNPETLPCPEEHAANPISPYGLSKHTAERYLWMYASLHGLKATVLRYANVYGPRQAVHGEAGVCAIFVDRMLAGQPVTLFGDGTQTRDYVYVGDVARANLLALEKGDGEAMNIGTGIATSTNEVFATIKEATGYALAPEIKPLRPGEIQDSYLDASKAERVLGWQAEALFKDGIAQTVAWARQRA